MMKGVGRREAVVWELEADVQGHKKRAPRSSCGSAGGLWGWARHPQQLLANIGQGKAPEEQG